MGGRSFRLPSAYLHIKGLNHLLLTFLRIADVEVHHQTALLSCAVDVVGDGGRLIAKEKDRKIG